MRKQLVQVVKLLTEQGVLDENDLAPLLSEVAFLARVDYDNYIDCKGSDDNDGYDDWWSASEEDVLVNCTALQLAVHFDLENAARVLLPQAGAAVCFASGSRP